MERSKESVSIIDLDNLERIIKETFPHQKFPANFKEEFKYFLKIPQGICIKSLKQKGVFCRKINNAWEVNNLGAGTPDIPDYVRPKYEFFYKNRRDIGFQIALILEPELKSEFIEFAEYAEQNIPDEEEVTLSRISIWQSQRKGKIRIINFIERHYGKWHPELIFKILGKCKEAKYLYKIFKKNDIEIEDPDAIEINRGTGDVAWNKLHIIYDIGLNGNKQNKHYGQSTIALYESKLPILMDLIYNKGHKKRKIIVISSKDPSIADAYKDHDVVFKDAIIKEMELLKGLCK